MSAVHPWWAHADRVLVATRSFHYVDQFGRRQEVRAGRTYVDVTTEAAKRFPAAFRAAKGPAISRPATRSRQAVSTFQPQFPSSGYEAQLKPPKNVRITWKVRRALQQTAADWSGDGLESGGFLFGRIRPHPLGVDSLVEILEFSSPSRKDTRGEGWMRSSLVEVAKALNGELSRLPLVGDWHTHTTRGLFQPSDTDIGAWGGKADAVSWREGRPPGYVGLIIGAEDGRDWLPGAMQMRAYFVQPLRHDLPPDEREPKPIPIREEWW